ncbi:restriction endonuclease subunit S [Xenorhabdus sp. Reich]|uniref:Restriction endonuclease subunit S n=1 Tax=Xenorhabdus littoralis TaxID=2582835 RepID=A0ABU4SP92_9GAMM|nr:restriction endonuclease subunit S [Xenorhabdus sp. Reich]MDX8000481.1 restriction endonuclease subunit S [Xenorhabdus sp. Reich]
MSKYQAYPEYKDSGVEWLGYVPSHWKLTQVKYGYNITLGKMLQKSPKSSVDILRPYLKAQNIQPNGINLSKVDQMWFSPEECKNLLLLPGDVLVSEGGDVGRSVLWNNEIAECYIQNAINRVRTVNDNSTKFFNYWITYLKASDYINVLCNKATIAHYTAEKLKASPLLLPMVNEQEQIADFLDHETAKIDTLIEKQQQQLIKLLKEKRQAVISHAVTKGLNLDVPMKDSGVEWLGNVPTHWNITRIGFHTLKIGSGKTPKGGAEIYQEDGVLFLRSQNIYDDGLRIGKSESVFISENIHEEMKGTKVYGGDILLNITGGSIGRSCLVPKNFIETNVNQHVCIIRMPKSLSEYVSLVMKSVSIKEQIVSIQTGGNREGLNFEQISKFVFCLPSEKERISLIKYIHFVLKKFDSLESKANEVIRLMQERRTALISAAVTGKIDVRHWQAPVTHQASNHSAYQSHLCRHDLSKVS